MSMIKQAQFYLTRPHPCSYLEETSQSIYLEPGLSLEQPLFSTLSRNGFRRSGNFIYRPHCPACNACIPIRLPVTKFVPTRQQTRTLKRGNQLQVLEKKPCFSDEYYALYAKYISQRHADGEMYPPSKQQFHDFLTVELPFVRFFEFRWQSRLMAVAVADRLDDGLSAVYTFFDPQDRYFSLGRYAVLWQVNYAQSHKLPYLYLGYWIKNSRKMRYKNQYQPIEVFSDNQWRKPPPGLF